MADQDYKGVRTEGRLIPPPASISAEARAHLESMVGADGIPAGLLGNNPSPDDHPAWRELKTIANARIIEMMQPRFASVTSTVETIELGGARVHVATPANAGPDDRAYVDIHGGALVYGEGEMSRMGAQLQAMLHGVRAYGIDYRTPPEHPYPAALDDCVGAYRALLDRYRPDRLVVGVGSAGGNLAAALALRARDEGLPLPAGLVLLTPETDLTESGDTFQTNQRLDVVLPRPLMNTNLLYAGGADLAHPYLSPLFGDFTKGFPPTLIQAGTRDLFLSNAVRMHRALRRAKVPVELHIFEAMPHGGFGGSSPEDREFAEEVKRFVAESWGA